MNILIENGDVRWLAESTRDILRVRAESAERAADASAAAS